MAGTDGKSLLLVFLVRACWSGLTQKGKQQVVESERFCPWSSHLEQSVSKEIDTRVRRISTLESQPATAFLIETESRCTSEIRPVLCVLS